VGVYSPDGGGGARSPWWHHGRARWLAGVGAGMHYSLQLPVVPSSNESGGRGVLTKGYSTTCSGGTGRARWQDGSSSFGGARARSNGRTESGPAQTDAVTASLHWLGVVGAQGAL
jgi:hypothetical protein